MFSPFSLDSGFKLQSKNPQFVFIFHFVTKDQYTGVHSGRATESYISTNGDLYKSAYKRGASKVIGCYHNPFSKGDRCRDRKHGVYINDPCSESHPTSHRCSFYNQSVTDLLLTDLFMFLFGLCF